MNMYHNFCIKLRKTKTNLKKSNFNIINIKKYIFTTAESTFLRKFIRKNLVTNYYLLVQALKITFHIFDAKKIINEANEVNIEDNYFLLRVS